MRFFGFASRKLFFHGRNSKLARSVLNKMLMALEHVALLWLSLTFGVSDFGAKSPKMSYFCNFPHLEYHPVDYSRLSTK